MRKKLLTVLLTAAMMITLPGIGTMGVFAESPADEKAEAQTEPDGGEDGYEDNELQLFEQDETEFSVIPGETVSLSVSLSDEAVYEPIEDSISYRWYREFDTMDDEDNPVIETEELGITDSGAFDFTYQGDKYSGEQRVVCRVSYKVNALEDDDYYDALLAETLEFTVTDSYAPIVISSKDGAYVYAGEKGDSKTLQCAIEESEDNEENDYDADMEHASFQWYQELEEGNVSVKDATSDSVNVEVTENETYFYLEASVPVTKGKGENKQTLTYKGRSETFVVKMHDLFGFEDDEKTINGLLGSKQMVSVDPQLSEYANSLKDAGYRGGLTYQWYLFHEADEDDDARYETLDDATESYCEVEVEDVPGVYSCEVTCMLKKGSSVFTQTVKSPHITVEPENAFYVHLDEFDTSVNEMDVYELPGYELEMKAFVSPNLTDDNEPKYHIGEYSYQWEKGSYVLDEDAEEETLVWTKINGATEDSYTAEVLKDDNEDYYRCGVSALVEEGTDQEAQVTYYAAYTVYYCENPMSFTVDIKPYYYDNGDEIELSASVAFSEDFWEEGDPDTKQAVQHGYTFDLTDENIRYQWEEKKEMQDGMQWVPISGAAANTLKRTAGEEEYVRFKILGIAQKDDAGYEYAFASDEIDLSCNLPIQASISEIKEGEEELVTGQSLYYQSGAKAVFEAEAVCSEGYEEVVSDLGEKGYQWYVWDRTKEEYVKLNGETKKTLSITVDQYKDLKCDIRITATVDGKERETTVSAYVYLYVKNEVNIYILAKDASGKAVSPQTKGQITLYAMVFGEDMTNAKAQWRGRKAGGYFEDIKGATGTTYTFDTSKAMKEYVVEITDRFGNIYEEYYDLPSEEAGELSTELMNKKAISLSVGKTRVKGTNTDMIEENDEVLLYTFTPAKTGIYRFYSSAADIPVGPDDSPDVPETIDPIIQIYNANGALVTSWDDLDSDGAGSYNFDCTYFGEKGSKAYVILGRDDQEYFVNIEYLNYSHMHVYGSAGDACLICGENKTPSKPAGTDNKQTQQPQTQQPQTQQPQAQTQPTVKAGQKIQLKKQGTFKVTNPDPKKAEVTFVKPANAKAAKIKVPASIKQGGVTYKVTKLDPKAFKGNKKVKEIDLGKNITKVDNKAFSGCTKLKKVIVRSSKIKFGKFLFKGCGSFKTLDIKAKKLAKNSFAKKSLSGMPKNAVVKVPKGTAKYYKNILKNSGKPNSIKIK